MAFAGRLQVTDEAHLLSSSDVSALQATASRWSFDTHVLVTVAPSKASLESRAHAWVDAPNVVVIALDPQHHSIITRFGNGTNVRSGDFDAISASGNDAFRASRWETGIEMIGARADASARTTIGTGAVAPQAPIVVHEGLGFWGWTLILLSAGFLVWVAVRVYRKSQRDAARFQRALDDNTNEMGALASRNIREDRWSGDDAVRTSPSRVAVPIPVASGSYAAPVRSGYVAAPAPVVVSPAPSTVVVNGGGNSGNGFVEGMLVGEMLHDHHHDTVVREREVYVERDRPYSAPAPSYDSGGSASTWGGSGSNDAGGGSSSYDTTPSPAPSYDPSPSYDSGSSTSYDSGSSGGSSDFGSSSDSGGSFDSGGGSDSF